MAEIRKPLILLIGMILAIAIILVAIYITLEKEENETEEENISPSCSLSINKTSGNAPLTVTFSMSASDSNASISSWELDVDNDGTAEYFGSGNPSPTKQHTYQNVGTYTAKLTVTDNEGAEATASVIITVNKEEWQPQYGIRYTVSVTNVIDGDTFDAIFPNGNEERVRLLGVDTPETTAKNNKPNEYDGITDLEYLTSLGVQAKYFAKEWLGGKDVYIEFDEMAGFKGYYGRWLAYVYLQNETDFNAELMKRGYARAYVEGTFSKENYYVDLQEQAMMQKIGLWDCISEEEGLIILTVHYDAEGDDRYNLNDEYVIIKNNGNTVVDLTGYTLSDEVNHTYTFPDVFLDGSATATVYTGSGVDVGSELYWGSGSPIWNNDHDTAYLKGIDGNLIDAWSW